MTTRQQVRRVLFITLILNIAVALSKILLGMVTGALAITADGFHSLTDSAGNIGGLIANYIASKPPDDDHPYGHRRFETMAALLIGGLLLLTAWEMIRGILERLQNPTTPTLTPLAFVIMLVTLLINIGVSRYQIRAGKRLHSEILLADAQHTATDIYVTISVLVSMLLITWGWAWVDVVAAVIVVALIGRAAWRIVGQTGRILVDTAPYSTEQLKAMLTEVPTIQKVIRARSRGTIDTVHIDIDVQVAPELTADHTAHITSTIEKTLHTQLDGIAEIEVHFIPQVLVQPDYALTARACADGLGLKTHEVRVIDKVDKRVLELHVEVTPEQPLSRAHEQVSQLEQSIQSRLPEIDHIVTHIEPAFTPSIMKDEPTEFMSSDDIIQQARSLLMTSFQQVDWHDFHLYPHNEDCGMTVHAALSPDITIDAAHRLAESAETLLRSQLPQLTRVTIHTEPFDH